MSAVGVLRRATDADLDLLVALAREFNEVDGHPHDDDRVRQALVPLLADDTFGQACLIVPPAPAGDGADPEPVGYLVVCWSYSIEGGGKEAVLDELYVRDRDRGAGLGSAAMAELFDRCRAAGMRRLFLETEAPNEQARRFYRRLGFTDEPSVWMSREL